MPDQFEALMTEALAQMEAGELEAAEVGFAKALALKDDQTARNNLAMALFLRGNRAEAMATLAPTLDGETLQPFGCALAAQIAQAEGDEVAARRWLRRAIEDFDKGLLVMRATETDPAKADGFIAYTTLIKETAGRLGDHRLVLDLHGRWPGRQLAQGSFYAGVAAFNLRRFRQAASTWAKVAGPGVEKGLPGYRLAAVLADKGTVPPFALEYAVPDNVLLQSMQLPERQDLSSHGWMKVMLLYNALGTEGSNFHNTMVLLVRETGDWGRELAENLLLDGNIPLELKMAAGQGLMEAGIVEPGGTMTMRHDGELREVRLERTNLEVRPITPEISGLLDKARRLLDRDKLAEAIALLEPLREPDGPIYPEALFRLGQLYGQAARYDEAAEVFRMLDALDSASQPDPAVLYYLALTLMYQGEPDAAVDVLERLDELEDGEIPENLVELIEELWEMLLPPPLHYLDELREDEDYKPINRNTKLISALRRLPVEWLDAAASVYGVTGHPRRAEREAALAEAILDADRMQQALLDVVFDDADEDGDQAPNRFHNMLLGLELLLRNGGWLPYDDWEKVLGGQAGDGFYWVTVPPRSDLGLLRLIGLVHVGTRQHRGLRQQLVVLPEDVRPAAQAFVDHIKAYNK